MKTLRYVEINENKEPLIDKFEDRNYHDTFEHLDNAGLILGADVIVVDFDGDSDGETKIIDYIEKNYPTSLCITTTKGKHFYFTMPKGYKFKMNSDVISVSGFQCDYLTGIKNYAGVKLKGIARKTNLPLTMETMNDLPVLPEYLYPLTKTKECLAGLTDGESRNDKLFYHLRCIREVYKNIDVGVLADFINELAFKDKLKQSELNKLVKSVSETSISDYKDKNKVNELMFSSAKELLDEDLPPLTFYVDGLIPQGTNIFCSVPKLGKSWLAIDLGLSISSGLPFLGFKTTQAGCLYLALEDSKKRLQRRLQKLLNGAQPPTDFYYSIHSDIGEGLIVQLEKFIQEKPSVKVIMIDTLQKVRGDYTTKDSYGKDYKELGIIKEFADANGLCVILIHHLRKANPYNGDIFERVLGTNGVMGTVDATYVLHKKNRSDEHTNLTFTGRDIDENTYVLKFDKANCKWNMIASLEEQKNQEEVAEFFNSSLVRTIKELVAENNGEWTGDWKTLAKIQFERFEEKQSPEATGNKVREFADLLKTIDKIEHIPPKYAKGGQRTQIFRKITVDTVDTVVPQK